MNFKSECKRKLPMCAAIVLIGCIPAEPHFTNDAIRAISVGGSLTIPASKLVSSDVAYICTLGPYSGSSFIKDKKMSRMVDKAGFKMIGETEGYLLYFDNSGTLLKSDEFEQWSGKYRWGNSSSGSTSNCLALESAAIRISHQDEYYRYSLEMNY